MTTEPTDFLAAAAAAAAAPGLAILTRLCSLCERPVVQIISPSHCAPNWKTARIDTGSQTGAIVGNLIQAISHDARCKISKIASSCKQLFWLLVQDLH